MYMSDIGQNIVEEVSPISAGANLGWSLWEGSYRFVSQQAGTEVEFEAFTEYWRKSPSVKTIRRRSGEAWLNQ